MSSRPSLPQADEIGALVPIGRIAKATPYSADFLRQLARSGKLRAYKLNRDWLTTPAAVSEYLKSQTKRHEKALSLLQSAEKAFLAVALILIVFSATPQARAQELNAPPSSRGAVSTVLHDFTAVCQQFAAFYKPAFTALDSQTNEVLLSFGQALLGKTTEEYLAETPAPTLPIYPRGLAINSATPAAAEQTPQVLGDSTSQAAVTPAIPAPSPSQDQELIDQTLQRYLASGKFIGPQGPQGPAGSSSSSIVQNGNGQTTSLMGGSPIVTYVPANPSNNFTGASIAGFTDLSSANFSSQSATIQGALTVSGSAAIAGAASIGGSLSAATSTLSSLTVSGAVNLIGSTTIAGLTVTGFNPGLTQGSVAFQGASGLSQDNANFFYNSASHELGLGTSSPTSTLFIQGSGSINPFVVASSTGAQLLTVLPSGFVGIGTTTPTTGLYIATGGNFSGLFAPSYPSNVYVNLWVKGVANHDTYSVLQAGTTQDARDYLDFADYTGAYRWLMGKNALNSFILYDSTYGEHRMYLPSAPDGSGGITYLSSMGAYPVRINDPVQNIDGGNTGTGGFEVWNGNYASSTRWFGVDSSGNTNVYTNASGSALNVWDPTGTQNLFSVNSSGTASLGVISGDPTTSPILYANPVTGVVGIGTSNPVGAFQINTAQTGASEVYFSGATSVATSSATGASPAFYVNNFNNEIGLLMRKVGSGGGDYLDIENATGQEELILKSNGNVGISTATPLATLSVVGSAGNNPVLDIASSSGKSLLRITATGNVGIGTTSPTYLLYVGSASIASGTVAQFQNANGTCGINPTLNTLTCSSDERLKKNVTPMGNDLSQVLALQPVYFNWNAESSGTPEHPGFIAQQVQQVMPEVVSTDPSTGLLSIGYSDLVPAMVSAMQQMQVEITALQGGLNGNASSSSLTVYSPANFSGDSVGEAQITAGQTSVRVTFSQAYAHEPIVTAFPEGAFEPGFIAEKDSSGFTLAIPSATTTSITFDWHSFASPAEQLTVSDGSTAPIVLIAPSAPVPAVIPFSTVSPDSSTSASSTVDSSASSTPSVPDTSTSTPSVGPPPISIAPTPSPDASTGSPATTDTPAASGGQ